MTAPDPFSNKHARQRVGLGDAIVLGLSSSGPAQTLAVSLASLVAASGYGSPVPGLLCLVPMLGIAFAYQRLNRWDQSSGATYTWVARVFNPYLGFLSGWMILLYYTLGTTTLTIPAGVYTLELFAPSRVNDHVAVFLVAAAWNVLITGLAVAGLKVAVRFEWVIVLLQYAVLLTVAGVAVDVLLQGHAAAHFSWGWFSLTGLGGGKGLMAGMLIACFMYSGWDAAVYVNEESKDRVNDPGRAAIASVVMLALIYSVAVFAFQAVLPPAELQMHAGDALSAVSGRLLGGPCKAVMALVVLTATLATLQAAVISATRVGVAMSRDRVMPSMFGRVRADGSTPWAATLTMGGVNLVLLALSLSTATIGEALTNAASSLGLISIVFYGITAAAALRQQLVAIRAGRGDLILGGVFPLIGVLFSVTVLVGSFWSGAVSAAVIAYGVGSIGIGAGVALILRWRRVPFFVAAGSPWFPRDRRFP
jgi:amino acid transporter